MTTLNTENLTLREVHLLLGLQKRPMGSFRLFLSLEPLTEFEQQELIQIADDFDNYLIAGKVSEGLVKALTTFPLMRLAGLYRLPLAMNLEEGIERVNIEDEETFATGRFDILSINQTASNGSNPFWLLVIESINSSVDLSAGLPHLLNYAFKSLAYQESVWGLVTNGLRYQFVYLRQGIPPTYQIMPDLNLFEPERARVLLQVMKAICKLQVSDF
ncbi:MAG TPA: restriction endonuclease subunit R [Cyanobacteria bacterium UBA8803]|nr:restriction endonuclease subunit R [Cyanobacteria bacterium UBA9273]HBL58693.1 restriction endonuclease subunit R [Cyanobacteria bacterium UBA8803]